MGTEKMLTVRRFLGLHEAADGETQLKNGEASKIENFTITQEGHLKLRPGLALTLAVPAGGSAKKIIGLFCGYLGSDYILAVAYAAKNVAEEADNGIYIYGSIDQTHQAFTHLPNVFGSDPSWVHFFVFGGKLYAIGGHLGGEYYTLQKGKDGHFTAEKVTPYVPLVVTGASPNGGGTSLEQINRLTGLRRIAYSGDGEAKQYKMPQEATAVTQVKIGTRTHAPAEVGVFIKGDHKFSFTTAPEKGVNNVEFTYRANSTDNLLVQNMRYSELYNGATDSRIFLYGDGTNRCVYSGVTESGEATAAYFPAMGEITVGGDDSPITGMIRHNNTLLCFKTDSVYAITYGAITLADGATTAGFYLRPAHRELGNQSPGQVQLVENSPRTIANGALYDWRVPSSYYRDERYAKCVSERVQKTMQTADAAKCVAYDDNEDKCWYLFLNDEAGTVLVHKYLLDAWTIYKSSYFSGVTYCGKWKGKVLIAKGDKLYSFQTGKTTDGDDAPIGAVWESGFLDFGADYMRKYSSYLWISMQPEYGSSITVTAQTDRRNGYVIKRLGANVFDWGHVDFRHWTFNVTKNPRPRRIKLKVKKFVYYKLIFRVDSPGARATILGYDQQVRYSSLTK